MKIIKNNFGYKKKLKIFKICVKNILNKKKMIK